jgi:hydrogenase maturation protein HypF
MDALTAIAVEHAEAKGIEYVGLTGGVAYNIPITAMVTEYVERNSNGLKLLLHNSIPNGDGGISAGQNVAIGSMNGS